jgi:hypothetical protein
MEHLIEQALGMDVYRGRFRHRLLQWNCMQIQYPSKEQPLQFFRASPQKGNCRTSKSELASCSDPIGRRRFRARTVLLSTCQVVERVLTRQVRSHMNLPPYFIRYEDVRSLSLECFSQRLRLTKKKEVGSVTIRELCATLEYPIGLYFFFDENDDLKYVGKSSSRSFVERIPSHFDPRFGGWFNTLPKKLMIHERLVEYSAAHSRSLEMKLILLGIQSKETVNKLEGMLRNYLQPTLNAGRGQIDGTTLLSHSEP